jgi:hypothetical protein
MQNQQAEAKAILAVMEPRRSESVKQARLKAAKPATNERSPTTQPPPSGPSKSKTTTTRS